MSVINVAAADLEVVASPDCTALNSFFRSARNVDCELSVLVLDEFVLLPVVLLDPEVALSSAL